jgi:hypothetical protein
MSSQGTIDRAIIPAKNADDCATNKGFSWLADKNMCASDCLPPGVPNWDGTRNVPICLVPQGAHVDERGARWDTNAHGDDPNSSGSTGGGSDIQTKATEAARATDVFYRDNKTGVEIPSTIPTEYLITGLIGLGLGFMFFRR